MWKPDNVLNSFAEKTVISVSFGLHSYHLFFHDMVRERGKLIRMLIAIIINTFENFVNWVFAKENCLRNRTIIHCLSETNNSVVLTAKII